MSEWQQQGCRGRGENSISNTEQVANYLKAVIENNPKTFRIFSPDELESNLITKVLDVTQRNFQMPTQPHDSHIGANGGRVLEILSEHTCQAWLQGYLLTGLTRFPLMKHSWASSRQ